jgi:methionine-S-sulfoxide reductase
MPDPDFEQVSSGTTGHVEAVRITFNPAVIGYGRTLEVFWNIHDPAKPAKEAYEQSAIFFSTENQQRTAESSRNQIQASGKYENRPVTTKILPASRFFRAEEHHQQFYEKCGLGYAAAGKYWE